MLLKLYIYKYMNIRKIIEQEVDKQEWGLELPKQVKLGDKTLALTDRGVYQGDDAEVEYKVDGDKILTTSDEELTPIVESDFGWINDIPDNPDNHIYVGSRWSHDNDRHRVIYMITDIDHEKGRVTITWGAYDDTIPISYFETWEKSIRFHTI